jgi:hypothetical protein
MTGNMTVKKLALVQLLWGSVVSRLIPLFAILCIVGCAQTNARLAKRIESSPSYQRLIAQRPDASWSVDYKNRHYAVVAIGASMDENLWHRWNTLRVWRSGLVERREIHPESEMDEQWVPDK